MQVYVPKARRVEAAEQTEPDVTDSAAHNTSPKPGSVRVPEVKKQRVPTEIYVPIHRRKQVMEEKLEDRTAGSTKNGLNFPDPNVENKMKRPKSATGSSPKTKLQSLKTGEGKLSKSIEDLKDPAVYDMHNTRMYSQMDNSGKTALKEPSEVSKTSTHCKSGIVSDSDSVSEQNRKIVKLNDKLGQEKTDSPQINAADHSLCVSSNISGINLVNRAKDVFSKSILLTQNRIYSDPVEFKQKPLSHVTNDSVVQSQALLLEQVDSSLYSQDDRRNVSVDVKEKGPEELYCSIHDSAKTDSIYSAAWTSSCSMLQACHTVTSELISPSNSPKKSKEMEDTEICFEDDKLKKHILDDPGIVTVVKKESLTLMPLANLSCDTNTTETEIKSLNNQNASPQLNCKHEQIVNEEKIETVSDKDFCAAGEKDMSSRDLNEFLQQDSSIIEAAGSSGRTVSLQVDVQDVVSGEDITAMETEDTGDTWEAMFNEEGEALDPNLMKEVKNIPELPEYGCVLAVPKTRPGHAI